MAWYATEDSTTTRRQNGEMEMSIFCAPTLKQLNKGLDSHLTSVAGYIILIAETRGVDYETVYAEVIEELNIAIYDE
jgi:hypothetical protein